MLIYYSIRLESSAKTSYLLGHTDWEEGPPGATIINITAWPSQPDPSLYYYNAFVANINDEEQMDMIIRGTKEEDDDYVSIDDEDSEDEDEDEDCEFGGRSGGGSSGSRDDDLAEAKNEEKEDESGGRKSYAEMTLPGGKKEEDFDSDDDDSDDDGNGKIINVAAYSDADATTISVGRMDIAEKTLAGARTSTSKSATTSSTSSG